MGLSRLLADRKLDRREFLKVMAGTAAVLGLSEHYVSRMVEAVEKVQSGEAKPPVIWMEGQDCAGCTESTIASLNPSAEELILDILSIRYHETIMAASGDRAREALESTVEQGGYVLILEGGIPSVDDRFCMVGGEPYIDHVRRVAAKAAVIVAAGSCAAYGGIPAAGPTGSKGASHFIKDKPVINVPSCPVKPSRLIGTLMHYLLFGKAPALDEFGRPRAYYRYLLHDNCPRRGHYDRNEFLMDWNDPSQQNYCLYHKGCKGQKTFTDCAQSWWNDGVNWCIGAGSPCSGCTEPAFYAPGPHDDRIGFSPLYQKQEGFPAPGFSGPSASKVGKALVGITGAGIAAHFVSNVVSGRTGRKKSEVAAASDEGGEEK